MARKNRVLNRLEKYAAPKGDCYFDTTTKNWVWVGKKASKSNKVHKVERTKSTRAEQPKRVLVESTLSTVSSSMSQSTINSLRTCKSETSFKGSSGLLSR